MILRILSIAWVTIFVGSVHEPSGSQEKRTFRWIEPTNINIKMGSVCFLTECPVLKPAIVRKDSIAVRRIEQSDLNSLSWSDDCPSWSRTIISVPSPSNRPHIHNSGSGSASIYDVDINHRNFWSKIGSAYITSDHMQNCSFSLNESLNTSISFIGAAFGFTKGGPHKPDTNSTQAHAYKRSDTHNGSPERRSSLRNKVILITLIIAAFELIFCLCLLKANRSFSTGDANTGLIYLISGVFGIIGYAVLGYLLIDGLTM